MIEQISRYIHHENRTAGAKRVMKRVMDIAIASFCLSAPLPLFGMSRVIGVPA